MTNNLYKGGFGNFPCKCLFQSSKFVPASQWFQVLTFGFCEPGSQVCVFPESVPDQYFLSKAAV